MQLNPNRITIETIKIKNFFSFKEAFFDFRKYSGTWLVLGHNHDIPDLKNGAGKTAFFSAILFGLYGETLQDVNVKSIHHRKFPNDPVEIEVTLLILGKHYRILAGQNSDGKSLLQLFENNVEISKPSIKDTRRFIAESLLQMSAEAFRRRIILTQENALNFFDMNRLQKVKFIEENFALNVFGEIYSNVHRDMLMLQKEISLKEQEAKSFTNIINDLKNVEKDFFENKQHRINAFNTQISTKITDIKTLIGSGEASVSDTIKTDAEKFNKVKTIIESLRTMIQEKENVVFKLKHKLDSYDKQITLFDNVFQKFCKTCERRPVVLEQIKSNLQVSSKEQVLEDIKKLQNSILELKTKQQTLQNFISITHAKQLKLARLKQEIMELKSKLEESAKNKSPTQDLIQTNQQKLKICETGLNEHIERYSYLNFTEYIVGEDGVKKFIIKNIINLLNSRIQHYLSKFGSTYNCVFSDDFDCVFMTESGSCEYNNFSSGERMRIKLASLFAFRDLLFGQILVDFNILVVDEFFDTALDGYAIFKLLEILQEISDKNQITCFIISHRKEILYNEMFTGKRVSFEKQNGITTILEDYKFTSERE
jgi:DNA repair exonuclease SbcCD ATPase subunit